jgi:hypothetical protein
MESNGSLMRTGVLPNRFEAGASARTVWADYLRPAPPAGGETQWHEFPNAGGSPGFVYWQNPILRVIRSLNSAPFVSTCFAVFLVKSGILRVS